MRVYVWECERATQYPRFSPNSVLKTREIECICERFWVREGALLGTSGFRWFYYWAREKVCVCVGECVWEWVCYSVPKMLAHISTKHVYVCEREKECVCERERVLCVCARGDRECVWERARYSVPEVLVHFSTTHVYVYERDCVCVRERKRVCMCVREKVSIRKCASTLTLSHTNPGTRGSCPLHYWLRVCEYVREGACVSEEKSVCRETECVCVRESVLLDTRGSRPFQYRTRMCICKRGCVIESACATLCNTLQHACGKTKKWACNMHIIKHAAKNKDLFRSHL